MTFALDHIGIAVKSLDAAKAIYEKLGMPVSKQEKVESEQMRQVMVSVGETRLELLEALTDFSRGHLWKRRQSGAVSILSRRRSWSVPSGAKAHRTGGCDRHGWKPCPPGGTQET